MRRQLERRKPVDAVAPLIIQVVDGVNGGCALEGGRSTQSGIEVDRQERSLPVVCVNDVELQAEVLGGGDDGAAEEGVPFEIVVEAIVASSVESAPIEVVIVRDEPDGDIASRKDAPEDLEAPGRAAVGDVEPAAALERHAVALAP